MKYIYLEHSLLYLFIFKKIMCFVYVLLNSKYSSCSSSTFFAFLFTCRQRNSVTDSSVTVVNELDLMVLLSVEGN